MKRTNRILPVYAADISGICSALYELGGMTVMHDASGCNSTSVSYTHLDVYKRQAVSCQGPAVLQRGHSWKPDGQTADCCAAVSYTHLDVYKRQVSHPFWF